MFRIETWTRIGIILAFFFCSYSPKLASSGELLSVSITKLPFNGHERVVGFEVKLTSAGVHALPQIPMGWGIYVDNDASWNTTIRGLVGVGAAALYAESFKDFVIIERAPHKEPEFKVEIEIATTADFVKERRHIIRMEELILRKVKDIEIR
jgi:hypothetical protein